MLPVGEGQPNRLLIFLRDNITHVVFTTKYDAPIQSSTYIEPLGDTGDNFEIGRILVTPTIRNGIIILTYTMGNSDCNCSFSTVTNSNVDGKTFTLSDASFIKVSGGDRVECLDSTGKYIDDRKVISRSGNIIVLNEIINNVATIRLKISRLAIVLNGTTSTHSGDVLNNSWLKYTKFKDSTMSYPCEEQILLN